MLQARATVEVYITPWKCISMAQNTHMQSPKDKGENECNVDKLFTIVSFEREKSHTIMTEPNLPRDYPTITPKP